tara:strand:+ start:335 stop:493 length:159 start_codon:yes stop_codon:yes gene_type:complete
MKHLKALKNVHSISISILEPSVEIAPHTGPFAGILRYHLGIKVPEKPPLVLE